MYLLKMNAPTFNRHMSFITKSPSFFLLSFLLILNFHNIFVHFLITYLLHLAHSFSPFSPFVSTMFVIVCFVLFVVVVAVVVFRFDSVLFCVVFVIFFSFFLTPLHLPRFILYSFKINFLCVNLCLPPTPLIYLYSNP